MFSGRWHLLPPPCFIRCVVMDVITRLSGTTHPMEHGAGCVQVCNTSNIDCDMDQVRDAAAKIQKWISGQNGDPLDLMRCVKFETEGFHRIVLCQIVCDCLRRDISTEYASVRAAR